MSDPVRPAKIPNAATGSAMNSSADEKTEGYSSGAGDPDQIDLRSFLAPPESEGEIGRLERYRILKELGRGGMGMVLMGEDTRLRRLAAIKVMLPKFARDSAARERFLREARAAAKINHDNVVGILQVDEVNGIPFIAMEFLKGAPLDQHLKDKGELSIHRRQLRGEPPDSTWSRLPQPKLRSPRGPSSGEPSPSASAKMTYRIWTAMLSANHVHAKLWAIESTRFFASQAK